MGMRMSGVPSCANWLPSVNCTSECTNDCGCTSTVIFSSGTPYRWKASTTSRALFIMVAESMLILAPIFQLG